MKIFLRVLGNNPNIFIGVLCRHSHRLFRRLIHLHGGGLSIRMGVPHPSAWGCLIHPHGVPHPSASVDASVPGRPRHLWGGVVRFSSLVESPGRSLFFADPLEITIFAERQRAVAPLTYHTGVWYTSRRFSM